jgi:ABC-type uncharacterized transport system ATPase subunit
VIVAPGIAMQFGANGCGKSTFMKILGGELLLGLGVPTAHPGHPPDDRRVDRVWKSALCI